jgi:hypothetical protein
MKYDKHGISSLAWETLCLKSGLHPIPGSNIYGGKCPNCGALSFFVWLSDKRRFECHTCEMSGRIHIMEPDHA